jgi:phenylalanyl-tRNA synthetase alpha chain
MAEISKEKIEKILELFGKCVEKAGNEKELEEARVKFLGRKSDFNQIMKGLKDLSDRDKKEIGSYANEVKKKMATILEDRFRSIENKEFSNKEWLDVTAPGVKRKIGRLNILSQTQKEIEDIFVSMGFEIVDGPEIETERYNFDALNIPKDHPARDAWDTFWLKQKTSTGERLAPRPHTSPMQIRYMEKHQPPFRAIIPGRCFRHEATDANHEHTFYQFEALLVGDDITVANFKDVAKKFFSVFFGKELEVRLRPSYFPFTEPSFEFDISCTVCGGRGCKSCKHNGWLEVGGAGMVNQRVFEAAGYEKGRYQGFAWGFGIERLAMMKYKIDDIRIFKSGDLRMVVN